MPQYDFVSFGGVSVKQLLWSIKASSVWSFGTVCALGIVLFSIDTII
jgi:hypothetical protein